jgi:hypothetical protein
LSRSADPTMTDHDRPKEKDAMNCRACGREERASEGYPCVECGTFICLICTFRGVSRCSACAAKAGQAPT